MVNESESLEEVKVIVEDSESVTVAALVVVAVFSAKLLVAPETMLGAVVSAA